MPFYLMMGDNAPTTSSTTTSTLFFLFAYLSLLEVRRSDHVMKQSHYLSSVRNSIRGRVVSGGQHSPHVYYYRCWKGHQVPAVTYWYREKTLITNGDLFTINTGLKHCVEDDVSHWIERVIQIIIIQDTSSPDKHYA